MEAAVAPDAAAPPEAVAAAEAPAEPELVEVWRPGGRSEERRPRHDRNRHHRPNRQDGAQGALPPKALSKAARAPNRSVIADGATATAISKSRARVRRPRVRLLAAEGAPRARASTREDKGFRRDRPEGKDRERDGRREKFGGDRKGGDRNKGERDRGREFGGKGGRDKRDSGPSHRQYATTATPSRDRDRPADPNSPFAKLAALKRTASQDGSRLSGSG